LGIILALLKPGAMAALSVSVEGKDRDGTERISGQRLPLGNKCWQDPLSARVQDESSLDVLLEFNVELELAIVEFIISSLRGYIHKVHTTPHERWIVFKTKELLKKIL